MGDVVLIHGTTQVPTGWNRLVAALHVRGHRGIAVDLAGDDGRSVDEYVEAVGLQVPSDLSAPIVVAHSGSGPVLPGAAKVLDARHQVWLAAIIPDGRRSLRDEIQSGPTDVFNPEWLGKDPTADPVVASYFLFHDCDLERLQWALTTLRRFSPAELYADPVALTPDIPSTYVVASRDRTLRPEWSRREARRRLDAEIVEIDAGHCPHVSKPEEIADLLDRLASPQ